MEIKRGSCESDNTAIRADSKQRFVKISQSSLINMSGCTVQRVDNSRPSWGSSYTGPHWARWTLQIQNRIQKLFEGAAFALPLTGDFRTNLQRKEGDNGKSRMARHGGRTDEKKKARFHFPQRMRCLMIPALASGLSAWQMSQQQTLCLGRRKASPLMCKHNQDCLGYFQEVFGHKISSLQTELLHI